MLDINDIIRSSMQGDQPSFRILVDRYAGYAFTVAFRIINEEEESKDIIQDVFISVWENLGSYRMEMNFTNWLYRIIVNKCYDSLRKKKRSVLVHPDSDEWNIPGLFSQDTPEEQLGNEEIGSLIKRLTNNLSAKQKIVFVLSELEGLPHDDIAGITGMSKDSVKSNLNYARRNIKTMLDKFYADEERREI